jgi:hypothetical protein
MPGSPQRSATTIDERSSVSSSTARDRFLDLVLSAVAADQIEAEPRAPGGAPPRVPKTIDLTQNRKVTPKTTQTMLPPNLCPSHGLPMVAHGVQRRRLRAHVPRVLVGLRFEPQNGEGICICH